ncbi:hypothetical protein VaNZ11_000293, partial [Volvox africanus]
SGLEEGSAAVLVLPARSQPAQPQSTSDPRVQAAVLLYTPIAIAPPMVASELGSLMHEMYRTSAAEDCPTDRRIIRAQAFTHHFSALISDIVSLLLGCERLADEAEDLATAADASLPGGVAAPGEPHRAVVLERNQEELQAQGIRLVSYLMEMGLKGTARYLLGEVQNAGMQVDIGESEGAEAVCEVLGLGQNVAPACALSPCASAGEARVVGGGGSWVAEGSGPAGREAGDHSAAGGDSDQQDQTHPHGQDAGGERGRPLAPTNGDRGSDSGPAAQNNTSSRNRVGSHSLVGAPRHTGAAAARLRDVLLGFNALEREHGFQVFLGGRRAVWAQRLISSFVLAAVLPLGLAVCAVLAGHNIVNDQDVSCDNGTSEGPPAVVEVAIGGGDAGSWEANSVGTSVGCRYWAEVGDDTAASQILQRLAGGLQGVLVGLGLAAGVLALPGAMNARDEDGAKVLRRRETLVWIIHLAAVVLLVGFVGVSPETPIAGSLLWAVCAAAALVVVLQPCIVTVRFLSLRFCWTVDILAMVATGLIRWHTGAQGRRHGPERDGCSNLVHSKGTSACTIGE